jgi:hypothetical protein
MVLCSPPEHWPAEASGTDLCFPGPSLQKYNCKSLLGPSCLSLASGLVSGAMDVISLKLIYYTHNALGCGRQLSILLEKLLHIVLTYFIFHLQRQHFPTSNIIITQITFNWICIVCLPELGEIYGRKKHTTKYKIHFFTACLLEKVC